jgi:hypothetical protein
MAAMAAMISACAYAPRPLGLTGFEPQRAEFNHGRVTVVLTDEFGSPMPGYRVDFTWQKPDFYKTSAFTNRDGQVTFTGVPDVAEVSINHDAGLYERMLMVPQRGSSELRVMVDTLGAFEQRRLAERAAMLGLRTQQ